MGRKPFAVSAALQEMPRSETQKKQSVPNEHGDGIGGGYKVRVLESEIGNNPTESEQHIPAKEGRITSGPGAETAFARRRRSPKETLGKVLREQRHALGLTQRELAKRLGVKAAHVAYLEGGHRRPSLRLLSRITEVLGLERERMFALAHPEVEALIGSRNKSRAPVTRDKAWTEFRKNKALLAQHRIGQTELKVLAKVNLLGKISTPRNYLFVLNAIRQAMDEED